MAQDDVLNSFHFHVSLKGQAEGTSSLFRAVTFGFSRSDPTPSLCTLILHTGLPRGFLVPFQGH